MLCLAGASGLLLSLVVLGVGDLDVEKIVFICVGHGWKGKVGLDEGECVRLSEASYGDRI